MQLAWRSPRRRPPRPSAPPSLAAVPPARIAPILAGHGTRATKPYPRAASPRLAVVLGDLRWLPASHARGLRPADHPVGAWRVERHAAPLGTVHQVREQRRD